VLSCFLMKLSELIKRLQELEENLEDDCDVNIETATFDIEVNDVTFLKSGELLDKRLMSNPNSPDYNRIVICSKQYGQ